MTEAVVEAPQSVPPKAEPAFADLFHYEGETLVVDDADALKKLDRDRWSPSSSKTMEKCPTRWVTERLMRGDGDPFDPAPLGTAGHLVLEILYGLPVAERTQERIELIVSQLDSYTGKEFDLVIPTGLGDIMRWKAAVLDKIAGIHKAEDPKKVLVAGLERALDTASVNGVPFNGRIDRTDFVTDAEGRITGSACRDYKTGSSKSDFARKKWGDDHGDQLRLYALALQDLDGRIPEEVSIIYTASGETYTASTDPRNMNRVAASFKASYDEMKESAKSARYRTGAGPLCGWCPMATICPAAAAAGKSVAKVDGANAGERAGIRVLPDPDAPPVIEPLPVVSSFDLPDDIDTIPVLDRPDQTHIQRSEPLHNPEELMNSMFVDDKTWVDAAPDGTLNAASYSATAVFGFAGWALEALAEEETKSGARLITRESVPALAATLAFVVFAAQRELTGKESFQEGLHTRLRGCLHSSILTIPLPFGGTDADWEQWTSKTTKRIVTLARTAVNLFAHGPGSRPWTVLAVDGSAPDRLAS